MKTVNILNNDSKIGRCVVNMLDLCGLNLLWLLFCLPVVTIGAATCGLHFALSKRYESDEGVYKLFLRSFRGNFKQATFLWVILLIVGLCLAACLWIVGGLQNTTRKVALGMCSIPVLLIVIIAGYGFPLIAHFNVESSSAVVVDSVMLSIAFFPKTIQVIALNLLPFVLVATLPVIWACIVFVWLPCGFSVTALMIEKCLEPVWDRLQKD